jgi:hypothetical protein
MKSTTSDTRLEKITRKVQLTGLTDIMFDRYAGDNKTQLQWTQKIYLHDDVLVIPTTNIVSFLSAHNTNSAPKRLRDKRAYKDIANACLSFTIIEGDVPGYIYFRRNGKPIRVGTFGESSDPTSGLYLHRAVARLDKGIPNPKERPVLPAGWQIEFNLSVLPNTEIKEQEIRNLFAEGGMAIGLGTYRGVFGKFEITKWD